MPQHETLAAVDLGSNSFHLQIGRVVDGQIYPLDTLREVVRIGAGLTADKRIDRATQARALETLRRFGERFAVQQDQSLELSLGPSEVALLTRKPTRQTRLTANE